MKKYVYFLTICFPVKWSPLESTAGIGNFLPSLLKVILDMDENGQRESGRHKADQYKSLHAQVNDEYSGLYEALILYLLDFSMLMCGN